MIHLWRITCSKKEYLPLKYLQLRARLPLQVLSSGKWQDTKPVKSEASEAILAAARGASPDNPVWLLPVGPCTNIANAILLAREEGLDLKSRIKIVWLGGGPERVNSWSFNGENDL